MASIEKRLRADGKPAWRAHYRTPEGKQRNKTFPRRADAERFLHGVEHAKITGGFVDPMQSRITVAAWGREWLAGQVQVKPSTRERYAGILRTHVEPRWGNVEIGKVTHAQVQRWITNLATKLSPASVAKVHRVFSQLMASATVDNRIARNPAEKIHLPRVQPAQHVYLDHGQVDTLATIVAEPYGEHTRAPHADRAAARVYGLVVYFLAYTGVRWGEMAALRVKRIDLLRRRAMIIDSVTIVRGQPSWGAPKNHERREVPLPPFLVDMLAEHLAGKDGDELVFTGVKGGVLRSKVFQEAAFTDAARRLGVAGLTPHKLRHTAASLAIASGANVKVVQQMLGHKSATMTLDLYGHLFPDQLDEVATAMQAARERAGEAAVAKLLPRPLSA